MYRFSASEPSKFASGLTIVEVSPQTEQRHHLDAVTKGDPYDQTFDRYCDHRTVCSQRCNDSVFERECAALRLLWVLRCSRTCPSLRLPRMLLIDRKSVV